MADKPVQNIKMAVSENHELRNAMNVAREEMEQRTAITNSTRPLVDGPPRKKGTFKITSVKLNDTADADSTDDLDESHTEMTEDYSSEILDASRATDYEQDTPSVSEDIPLTVQSVRIVDRDGKERPGTDMHSRFRVVKIETTEPFHRGRWICHDFLDPLPSVNTDKSDTKVSEEGNSGSSSAASSIHYVHGVDDPSKNPLLAGATGTVNTPTPVPEGLAVGTQESFQPIQPASTATPSNIPMVHLPQSQVSTQGYFPDQSMGQSSMSSQMISQSHSHQSISSSLSKTDVGMPQPQLPPPATGVISTAELYSGQVNISNPLSSLADSTSGVMAQGIYRPNFSMGEMMPGTSIGVQSVYANALSSADVSENTSINSQSSLVNTPGPGTSTYQTYVHLGGQQIVNPSIVVGGQSESILGKVDQNPMITETVSDTKPNSDNVASRPIFPASDLTGALDKDLTEIQNQTSLSPALVAAVEELHSPEEDQSGSSTVAIDNKIEQAMDLVKSHLMFAVREEVDVLKEQIRDLVERMSQLEYENGILRAAATPETLALLAQPRQPPPPSSS